MLHAFLSTQQSQGQMDALLVGPQQQYKITPTRYGHCVAVQCNDTLKYLNKTDPLCV